MDAVSKSIRENLRTEDNIDGFLLGQADDYTRHLVVNVDSLRSKFVADKKVWDEASEAAEQKKAEYDSKMKAFMEDA